jgi:hypothetical protein
MMTQAYPERVLELFMAAPGAGRPEAVSGWAQGESDDPLSQTRVRFYLRGSPDKPVEARYEVRGCPYTVAAAALIALRVNNAASPIDGVEPRQLLQELEAPVPKLGRILVVEEAYRRALQRLPSIA